MKKRLISLLLVLSMLLPCVVSAEFVTEPVFSTEPVLEDAAPVEDIVLPDVDDALVLMPTVGVNGPTTYRELELLQPTALVGEAVSINSIRMAWEPVAFATQYDIYRKVLGETDYTYITSTPSEQLYYEDTTVQPGVVYYYRVQAANVSYVDGQPVVTYSPQSNTLPFMTLEAPVLNDPRGLDDTTMRLTWGSVAGYPMYEVEMATSPSGPFEVVRTDLTTTHCNVANLTTGQGYYFRMRAVRAFSSGERFYSEYSAPVKCGTPMQRPELAITGDGTSAILTWSESAAATGYVIYRKVGASGSYEKLTVTGPTSCYVDTNLTPGEVYYYFVYSMSPVGTYNCFSLSSETRYFTVVEAAEIIAVENTGEHEQTIDWTGPNGAAAPAGANKYLVFSATEPDGEFTQIGETTATIFTVTNLTPNKVYYYKVRAVRTFSNGDVIYGPWSNVMSQAEAGEMRILGWNAYNATLGQEISGGYVGDEIVWETTVAGGSGAYAFRYTLVSLNGAGKLLLKDFGESYTAIPEGEESLTASFTLDLTDDLIDLINTGKYAMQIEVLDSDGTLLTVAAGSDTYAELNFVAPRPASQTFNITLRAGESFELTHGSCDEAGDSVIIDISNPTGAVKLEGNVVTGLHNGYATVMITSERFKDDFIIIYTITVGHATLAVNSVTPSATEVKSTDTIVWDINFTGGKADYTVTLLIYQGNSVVARETRMTADCGLMTIKYAPGVAGDYALEVFVSSADGQTASHRSAVVKMVEYKPVKLTPAATSSKTEQPIIWNTTYDGTETVVRCDYTLYCDGSVVATKLGTADMAFTYTPTQKGSYVLVVTVYESNGTKITVTASTVTVSPGAPAGSQPGRVNAVRVALRKGPGTSYGYYFRIDKGEIVNVIKEQDGWYYVEYEGQYGWMMSKYVTLQ